MLNHQQVPPSPALHTQARLNTEICIAAMNSAGFVGKFHLLLSMITADKRAFKCDHSYACSLQKAWPQAEAL